MLKINSIFNESSIFSHCVLLHWSIFLSFISVLNFYDYNVLSCFSHVQLCNSIDCSRPASSVHRIFQARILEWVAMVPSRRSSWPKDWTRPAMLQADSLPHEPQEQKKTWNNIILIFEICSFLKLFWLF